MKFRIIPVTSLQQNCTLIWCESTNKAAFIDPGGDVHRLERAVERGNLQLTMVLLTHGHVDHVGVAGELAEHFGVPIVGPHRQDAFWIESLPRQVEMFSFPPARPFKPNQWLGEGDTIEIGEVLLTVLHCPGHTPGHVVFYHADSKTAFVGDVLFKGSIGRTDFPGGDQNALLDSIRNKLLPLGDNVTFIPGHGPVSTLGEERQYNPFINL